MPVEPIFADVRAQKERKKVEKNVLLMRSDIRENWLYRHLLYLLILFYKSHVYASVF